MPIAPRNRVRHIEHPEWGLGEVSDTTHPSGLSVFFEWVGDRFNIRAEGLRLAMNGRPSPILDALRIHGNSQASHSVYVIELDNIVWRFRKFRGQNPKYLPTAQCIYVGCTGLSVEQRFANHKRGHKSNWLARYYGKCLLHPLFEELNPRRYGLALATEFEFARKLRIEGYAVFQN